MSSMRSMVSTLAENDDDVSHPTTQRNTRRLTFLYLVASSVERKVLVHRTNYGCDGGRERSWRGVRDVGTCETR